MAALRAHLADVVHAHVETARRTRLRVPAQRGAIFGERCQPTFLGPATPGWCHCGDSLSLFYHRPGRGSSNRMLRYFGSQNGTNASATDAFAPCREHRSEEHTSELQSPCNLVGRLLLEKKK